MTVPVGAIAQAGLTVLNLLSKIKIRKPEARAKSHRAKAKNLREAAASLQTEIKRHGLNARNGSNAKFHERMARKLERKRARMISRATWWENQAERLDPR